MISTPISASLLALSPLNSLVMAVAGGGSCSVRIPAVILEMSCCWTRPIACASATSSRTRGSPDRPLSRTMSMSAPIPGPRRSLPVPPLT